MAVPLKPSEPLYFFPLWEPGYQPLGLMDRVNKEALTTRRLDQFVKQSQLISPTMPLRQKHRDAFSVVPCFFALLCFFVRPSQGEVQGQGVPATAQTGYECSPTQNCKFT